MSYNQQYFDEYHKIEDHQLTFPDENVLRFLSANFPRKKRQSLKILDLGCGIGRHIIALSELGFQAYGIDGSPVAIEYLKKWLLQRGLIADVRVGNITELPYKDNSFAGIIEHATLVNNVWEDIVKACNECFRVLKDGGIGFFLLKRKQDCAFDQTKKIEKNTYRSEESIFLSRKVRVGKRYLLFHAFTKNDIKTMFCKFKKVNCYKWDMNFKSLSLEEEPGKRRTAYWIVTIQK